MGNGKWGDGRYENAVPKFFIYLSSADGANTTLLPVCPYSPLIRSYRVEFQLAIFLYLYVDMVFLVYMYKLVYGSSDSKSGINLGGNSYINRGSTRERLGGDHEAIGEGL